MEKCHYYLSNGLWKIAQKYFDPTNKLQNEYFWAIAVLPNNHSYGSHIISTPWQQSWMAMDILEDAQQDLEFNEDGKTIHGASLLTILRKEVDFQYTLRNYSSDIFVQQLFSIYSKIQTHLLVNFSEAEIKSFNSQLKALFKVLLKETPSTAHTLLRQILQHGFFVNSCKTILHELDDDEQLCNLVVSCFCENEMIQYHLPYMTGLLQSPFRYNLCLLLLATDNISLLQAMIEEDKKLFKSDSRVKLQSLMDNGLQPLSCFSDMIIMERHFLLLILDLINAHLDEFPVISKSQNIPSFVWPIILLQNWNNPSLSDELLLQLIEKCKESTRDKTITQITYILEWYINFCKWCEKHDTSQNKEFRAENKQSLLEKAKNHSVLYLINNTTDLSLTDWLQIRDLLKQNKSKDDNKKSWDLVLFDGYCIMMLIFQAIVISSEIDHIAKSQKVKLTDISVLNDLFCSLYNEEVTSTLKKVKIMLQSLYPLAFRLEILENIFAAVFITYEDVRELSYFLNASLDFEKYLEKSQLRNKTLISEKSGNFIGGESFNIPGSSFQIFKKPEEKETTRKLKLKGFVCKKYIVRDLIYLVKECLEKLEEDPGTQWKEDNIDVPCSIKPVQVENRLDRLLESVSEATWRLQLVTDPDFISQIGSMQYACGQDPNHHFDGEWIYLSSDLDRSALLKTRKKSAEKLNDSGSHSNSSPGNGNCSAELQSLKQHKTSSGYGIMNQMLACDSSLVVHCLAQGDVLNADHIIQMMSTEENRHSLEGELNFTRAINDLKKKIQNISLESPARKSVMDSVSKSRSLQSIQIIANQGVNSTVLTNHVERFLSAYTLPSIQSHSKVSAGSVLQCVENTAATVTIDLALTTAKTFQDFKDLLNIASKYCPELNTRIQSPISAQTTSTKPLGYIVFTQNMIALLQEINRSQVNESDLEISLQQYLRSHHYPFSLKSLKDNINFWKHLNLAFLDFEKNLQESKTLVNCKEGVLSKCQKNIKDTQNIFESVIKLAENCGEFMDLGKADASGEISKNVNYCDLLCRYLSDLASFVLENVSSKAEDISQPITFHNLLEQSAVDILDKLIFEYHIEPGVLEKKAQQLGFNLSASLIAGICPRLPQMVLPVESTKCPPADRIVLNELFSDYKSLSPTNPNEVVRSILSELLIAFQTFSQNKRGDENGSESTKNLLTANDISELRNDMKIQRILEKTLEINFVELKSLNEFETLMFFFNLLNLMMCHCYLCLKLDKSDGVYSKYSFFRDVSYASLGYNVGELGFMSIIDIKQKILGENLSPGFSPRSNDKWSRLQLQLYPDPRLMFAIINFRSSSPPLFLVNFDNYDTQIEGAITNYVEAFVSVEDNQLVISDLLERYLNNVISNQDTNNIILSGKDIPNKIQLLLKFLVDHSRNELHDHLSNLLPTDISLKIDLSDEEIMLKLDYNVTYPTRIRQEKFVEKWLNRSLSDSILRHFSQSSRVLADIVQKIHEAKDSVQTEVARDVLTEEKLKYLDLLFSAPWLQYVSPLFHRNTVIAALSKYPEEHTVVEFFQNCVANKEWNKCLDVLFALPDYYVFSNLSIKRFKDIALREATIMVSREGQHNSWYYSEHISDINIRIETVMDCCKYWPGLICCSQLSSVLRDYPNLPSQQRDDIKCLVDKIKVYNRILEVNSLDLDAKTWFDICEIATTSPNLIIKHLVKSNQLQLCLQWISLPGILNIVHEFIDSNFLLPFFEHLPEEVDLINLLVNSLDRSKLIEIYNQMIFQLTSVFSIHNLLQRALKLSSSPMYRLVEISLTFLLELEEEEQSRLVHLISSPLLIIEQLLMNMKLDALEKVLKKARQVSNEAILSQDEINKLIVSYASKAVELDLVKAVKNSEVKQSFLLGTVNQAHQDQAIPLEVPDKSQWVPDNTVSLCMCCRLVTFSMFNRRHHCRRCGRVVCGTCSTYRMKVPGYRGVSVRVCQNCFHHQTKVEDELKCSQSIDTLDNALYTQDLQYWKLYTDPSRNATIRDEFSYEYSPNVTLCLAIFNLVPDATYTGVLLEESEKMLKVLQLSGKSGNPEVDCGVVVQIIRSLIMGAKVRYGRAGLMSGVECCDELLSQVDLLQLLINNYCSSLIPAEPLSGITLRCLRDKLVEEELWELALEVSTKCGLDRNGVWAAWGKVCLAAGSWEEARIKFGHCLKASKPARNPSLVDEICRILESPTSYVSIKAAPKLPEKGGVMAQEVIQILSTLKQLSQGKALPLSVTSAKNSVQYEEQIYYLTTYGSHQALLSFYLKQDELKTAFSYFLDQNLEPDLFFESLVLPCYKSEQHEKFKSVMLAMDASLESFKKYLSHTCVCLQKAGYLHTLYDIQILMQDYVRAAVTCIHLYQKNPVSFTDLVSRSSYLHMALKHLEEELAALNKKTKRLDCIMKMDPKKINHHMNTIWRQLEAAKFLASCESVNKFTVNDLFPGELTTQNEIPTLFDGNSERNALVKMIILLGKNISEGFGIAFRIVQDHQLDLQIICTGLGKKLAEDLRISDIKSLVDCLKTSGVVDVNSIVDEMISTGIPVLVENGAPLPDLEPLPKLIKNINLRISAFIDTQQLVPAYILAAKHNRLNDVQRIMVIADQQDLPIIKKICMSKLGQSSESGSKEDRLSISSSENR